MWAGGICSQYKVPNDFQNENFKRNHKVVNFHTAENSISVYVDYFIWAWDWHPFWTLPTYRISSVPLIFSPFFNLALFSFQITVFFINFPQWFPFFHSSLSFLFSLVCHYPSQVKLNFSLILIYSMKRGLKIITQVGCHYLLMESLKLLWERVIFLVP